MTTLTQGPPPVNSGPAAAAEAVRRRAPKGGCTAGGRAYKGGQFCLPYDPADPHGPAAGAPEPAPARVAIHGFVYAVAEIPAGECGVRAFELHKLDTNNRYHVLADAHGEVTCDCPDFAWKRAGTGRPCKHGRTLVELGLLPAPAPRVDVTRPTERWVPLTPYVSVREAVPPARARPAARPRFIPTPEDMAAAARLFAEGGAL